MSERTPTTPDPGADAAPTGEASDASLLEELRAIAAQAQSRKIHFFLSHQAHFLDPLVPDEYQQLRSAGVTAEMVAVARRIVDEDAARSGDEVPRIYFPVPMARSLEAGAEWDAVEGRFRYDMIVVDQDQEWWWRGRPVAERTKKFFSEHFGWQPAVGRWFFEYKIHDGWWDKSYLEAEITPLLGVSLEADADEGEPVRIVLQSGRRVEADTGTLRLDEAERLFLTSAELGEVQLAATERFRVLSSADEELATVTLAGRRVPLHWPRR